MDRRVGAAGLTVTASVPLQRQADEIALLQRPAAVAVVVIGRQRGSAEAADGDRGDGVGVALRRADRQPDSNANLMVHQLNFNFAARRIQARTFRSA